MPFPSCKDEIPYLSTLQMIEVDRAMMEDYGIGLLQMMENAGRNLATLAKHRFWDGNPIGRRVVVMAGTGGNGGGALVAARRLANWGAHVTVLLTRPPSEYRGTPAVQLAALEKMQVPLLVGDQPLAEHAEAELILDGIIGYSLAGAPRGIAAQLIDWGNSLPTPILSLDVPSGLDAGDGTVFAPAIRATATMTLALPKRGLNLETVEPYVGELYLADISVPSELYAGEKLGLCVGPIFAESEILHLR